MKEVALDQATVDAYQAWVQYGIRRELNSVGFGPGKLPFRSGVVLVVCAFCCLLVGILLVSLRMKHVYLWDWNAQFLGPFFFILFLLCMASASYMFILAKQRSNKYRSELYFRPVGDWGVSCIHKSEIVLEEEAKHELKSGTTPHKPVKPRSEAYSQSSRGGRQKRQQQINLSGKDNFGYEQGPRDASKSLRHNDQQRGPPPSSRRGPPLEGRRGPPTNVSHGIAPTERNRPHGPPSNYQRREPENRRQPPEMDTVRDRADRRPQGIPRFDGVRRLPDENLHEVRNIPHRSHDESDI